MLTQFEKQRGRSLSLAERTSFLSVAKHCKRKAEQEQEAQNVEKEHEEEEQQKEKVAPTHATFNLSVVISSSDDDDDVTILSSQANKTNEPQTVDLTSDTDDLDVEQFHAQVRSVANQVRRKRKKPESTRTVPSFEFSDSDSSVEELVATKKRKLDNTCSNQDASGPSRFASA